MKYYIPRMTSFVLASGIFFSMSCSNLQKTQSDDLSDSATIQEQIQDLNRQISDNPENQELQVERANLLYHYSLTMPNPGSRHPVYVNIRDIADNFISQSGRSSEEMDDLLVKAWRKEQQSGIKLLQNDPGERSDEQVSDIITHFENAITVLPDSLKTYRLLATTHYQHGNVNKAIETLDMTGQESGHSDPDIKEKLAYLYLEAGNLAEAEKYYNELVTDQPENLDYKHGLVNVLILSEKHGEAIDLLEKMSEEYSTRYTYQESLATELYYLFKEKTSQYIENKYTDDLTGTELNELKNLLNNIHSIFVTIQESLPNTEESLFRMAAFYKNASLRLKELPGDDVDSILELQNMFMEYSLPHWERLAELNPDNLVYVNNLHQVYLELDMVEDAEIIERSYNF